jgi:hypothetical protein
MVMTTCGIVEFLFGMDRLSGILVLGHGEGFSLLGRVNTRRIAVAIRVLLSGMYAWAGECINPRDYATGVVRIERVVESGAPRSLAGSASHGYIQLTRAWVQAHDTRDEHRSRRLSIP